MVPGYLPSHMPALPAVPLWSVVVFLRRDFPCGCGLVRCPICLGRNYPLRGLVALLSH